MRSFPVSRPNVPSSVLSYIVCILVTATNACTSKTKCLTASTSLLCEPKPGYLLKTRAELRIAWLG
jgi:hypothetical protein